MFGPSSAFRTVIEAVFSSDVVRELDAGTGEDGFSAGDRTVILATTVSSGALLTRVIVLSSTATISGIELVCSVSSVEGILTITRGDTRRVSVEAWPEGTLMARVLAVGVGPDEAPVAEVVEDEATFAVTLPEPLRALRSLTELELRSAGDPPIMQPFTVVCADTELRVPGVRRAAAGVAALPRVPSSCGTV